LADGAGAGAATETMLETFSTGAVFKSATRGRGVVAAVAAIWEKASQAINLGAWSALCMFWGGISLLLEPCLRGSLCLV
jgi:hypothetical protein